MLGSSLGAVLRAAEVRRAGGTKALPGGCSEPCRHQTALGPPVPPHCLPPFINQNLGVHKDSKDDTNIGNLLQIWACTCTHSTPTSGRGYFSPTLNMTQPLLSPKKQKLVHIFQGPLTQQLLLQTSFHG